MKKALVSLAVLVVLIAACQTGQKAIMKPQVSQEGRSAVGANGVVAAAKPGASQVGLDILKAGGNAVDAAVATGFALGVLEPNASGLGGGGFMIIKLVNMPEAVVIDFRETAPGASTPAMYLDESGKAVSELARTGGLASGTPGEVAGLLYALDNYGSKKLSREQVMQPAVDLAENGYEITFHLMNAIIDNLARINRYPAAAAIYTHDGLPYEEGEIIKNPDLGATLRLIAQEGKDAFYKGPLAERIAGAVQDAGGILTVQDLANYEVKIRRPVKGSYRGYGIQSTPPASSGGTHVIQILNMLENLDMGSMEIDSTESVHAWTQALRLAFADRGAYMADSDFVSVPLDGLVNKDYAKELYAKFDPNTAMLTATASSPEKYESGSTTSFAVMDKAGNMVAVTKSINGFYGSAVVVPGGGFIMNNHMADFMLTPGHVQSVEPGKRPLSSMTPTLVFDPSGKPFMTLGSPGGTRIIAAVAETISFVIDHQMAIQDAVERPRFFASASGPVYLEGGISEATTNGLKNLGYDVNYSSERDPSFGGVHAVVYDRYAKLLYGGADFRRDGHAKGY
ncbi:gamma-glutamyltranspeptidase [Spirochaetia bacterium]|nr:gamma-glutamyltranspeptidase [Spirochaetia bacterium]